jgi:hypothetical protein
MTELPTGALERWLTTSDADHRANGRPSIVALTRPDASDPQTARA